MRTEPFEFQGEHGPRLVGKLDLPDGPVHAHALFAHCFTCTKESLAAVRIGRALAGQDIGVLRFDFTGLGQSGGDFADSTFSGSVQDLLAAARAMGDVGKAPALLIGHSLGGAAVLAAAASLPGVKAIATIGAPCDVQHVKRLFGDDLKTLLEHGEAEVKLGGRPFKMRRSFIDDLSSHDQKHRIGSLRRALLVLHAPTDRTVDIDNAAQIFQAAKHPKSFVSLDDADHLLTRSADSAPRRKSSAPGPRATSARPLREASASQGKWWSRKPGKATSRSRCWPVVCASWPTSRSRSAGWGQGPPHTTCCVPRWACTAMTVRMYARRKGLRLRRVRVCVGHARTKGEDLPDGFMREVALEGDLTNEERSRLLEIAERCPVHASLKQGARVVTQAVGQIVPLAGVESAGQHLQDMTAA